LASALQKRELAHIKQFVSAGKRQVNTPWHSPSAEVNLNITNQVHANSTTSKMSSTSQNTPFHHTQKLKVQMRELIAHLRDDVGKVTEAKAQAMFETSAEVITGLVKAFDDYEKKNEEAWKT
jgi:hypothetical protein